MLEYLIKDLKILNNDELVKLGECLYTKVFGIIGLENECFEIASNLWEVYMARGDLKSAIKYLEKLNLESPRMYQKLYLSLLRLSKQPISRIF